MATQIEECFSCFLHEAAPVPHHEHPASEDPSEALASGSGEQWQVSWSPVAKSRTPTLSDPLETRHTPHASV